MARAISDEELQLKRRARRRLIGAIVLVTAIVVVLPMLLDTEPKPVSQDVAIRIPSPDAGTFNSKVTPLAPKPEAKAPAKPAPQSKPQPKPAPEKLATAAPKPAAPKPAPAPEAVKAPAKAEPVKQAAPAPTKPESMPYVVQVIALADAEKAKQMQARIAGGGIKSYTEVVKTAKGDVTRVRAGPFATREAAEKAREQLKAMGLGGNIAKR